MPSVRSLRGNRGAAVHNRELLAERPVRARQFTTVKSCPAGPRPECRDHRSAEETPLGSLRCQAAQVSGGRPDFGDSFQYRGDGDRSAFQAHHGHRALPGGAGYAHHRTDELCGAHQVVPLAHRLGKVALDFPADLQHQSERDVWPRPFFLCLSGRIRDFLGGFRWYDPRILTVRRFKVFFF